MTVVHVKAETIKSENHTQYTKKLNKVIKTKRNRCCNFSFSRFYQLIQYKYKFKFFNLI